MASKEGELGAMRHDGGGATALRDRPDKRVLDSQSLFAGARELQITHNGEAYLLRMTRLGKLILTK